MSINKRLRELLAAAGTSELTNAEKRDVARAVEYFGVLDDHVLVEVTRFAVCACAFRLAVNRDEINVNPTPEVFKQALVDTLKLIQKSVDDDF